MLSRNKVAPLGAALSVGLLSIPAAAWALEESGPAPTEEVGTVVFLVLMVAALYLAAHFAVDWLQHRFLVISGVEYMLLGLLIGPLLLNAVRDLTGLGPVIALAAGWVGLMLGTDCTGRMLRDAPPGTARIVLVHHLVPGLLVAGVAFYALLELGLVEPALWQQAAIAGGVLGCAAAADSTAPFDLLARRYHVGDEVAPTLRRATRLGDVVVILAFGLLFCLFHWHAEGSADVLGGAQWAWITLGLGVGLGLLLTPFLGKDESSNASFLALVGVITFASGAAYYVHLSSLAVNLLLGVVLVNARPDGKRLRETLVRTERPINLALLVFAGALWRPSDAILTLLGLVAFIVLRAAGKFLASQLAAFGHDEMRRDLYKGLLAHGDVTIAMAVSFRLVYDGPAVELAYSVILGSVVIHDLVAPRILRSLLVDAGDVRSELLEEPNPPVGATRSGID